MLISKKLNIKVVDSIIDKAGRVIILKINILDHLFYIINIYAPSKVTQLVKFYKELNLKWNPME